MHKFSVTNRRLLVHCRLCGGVFCGSCSDKTAVLEDVYVSNSSPLRVCRDCHAGAMSSPKEKKVLKGPAFKPSQRLKDMAEKAFATQDDAVDPAVSALSWSDILTIGAITTCIVAMSINHDANDVGAKLSGS